MTSKWMNSGVPYDGTVFAAGPDFDVMDADYANDLEACVEVLRKFRAGEYGNPSHHLTVCFIEAGEALDRLDKRQ